MFADQCLYVNKSLNSACLSYKVIFSLQNIWNKLLNRYRLVLRSLYERFSCVESVDEQKSLRFHKKYLHLCSDDEQKLYGFVKIRGFINERIVILG